MINTKVCACCTVWQERVSFREELPEQPHHRAFPPAVSESGHGATSSPAFDAVTVLGLGLSRRCVTASGSALVGAFLTASDVEHLSDPYLPSVYLLW